MTPEERADRANAKAIERQLAARTTSLESLNGIARQVIADEIRAAIAEEREDCAKFAEAGCAFDTPHGANTEDDHCPRDVAAAIRARSTS